MTSVRFALLITITFQVMGLAGGDFKQPEPAAVGLDVFFHPDGWLEAGDLVSMEVYSKPGQDLTNQEVKVSLRPSGDLLGTANFDLTQDGRYRATLLWAWDTKSRLAGLYTLEFAVSPAGITWQEVVELRSAGQNPPKWGLAETDCCRIHYITGTPAEKDLANLIAIVEQQEKSVKDRLGISFGKKIDLNLIPRILGQGGFSGEEIYFSVPQVNYIAIDLATVLHHELVHNIDGQIKSDFRPLIFMEGLAVYLTGGHYKPEPILPRAAALAELGLYIPLQNLSRDFYAWQHEAGYLQAAALVEYMINTWGRDRFDAFYRNIHPDPAGDPQAIDSALLDNFGIHLADLDDRFKRYLENFPVSPDLRDDVAFSVDYFEVIRRYQQKYDPSAYFRQVWLPDAAEMRKRGISADFTRRLVTEPMAQIETNLAAAGSFWKIGQLDAARHALSEALQIIEN